MEFTFRHVVVEMPIWVPPASALVTAHLYLLTHRIRRALRRPIRFRSRLASLPAALILYALAQSIFTRAAFGFPDASLCVLSGPPAWVHYLSLITALAPAAYLIAASARTAIKDRFARTRCLPRSPAL